MLIRKGCFQRIPLFKKLRNELYRDIIFLLLQIVKYGAIDNEEKKVFTDFERVQVHN